MEDTVNVHDDRAAGDRRIHAAGHGAARTAYKAELQEERRRREQLEKRMNEMAEENKRSRAMADEAQRSSSIRAELQRLGVTKVDLAYKAVQDGIVRTEDGRLVARAENGEQTAAEYLVAVRAGESGVSAGAHRGRDGNDGGTEVEWARDARSDRSG